MRYLSVNDVLDVHASVCDALLADFGLLESAVLRPQTTLFEADAYPTIHLKAAALLHSLARNHPFVDGNKRTALLATLVFYGLNGWEPVAGDAEWISVVLDAAEGQIDVPGIAKAIEEYVRRALLPEE